MVRTLHLFLFGAQVPAPCPQATQACAFASTKTAFENDKRSANLKGRAVHKLQTTLSEPAEVDWPAADADPCNIMFVHGF